MAYFDMPTLSPGTSTHKPQPSSPPPVTPLPLYAPTLSDAGHPDFPVNDLEPELIRIPGPDPATAAARPAKKHTHMAG